MTADKMQHLCILKRDFDAGLIDRIELSFDALWLY
jgi:hypothetical protein